MAVFSYRATTNADDLLDGTICADSPRAARDALRERGLLVEKLVLIPTSGRGAAARMGSSRRFRVQRTEMVRELGTLLAAGIPLLDAINSIAVQQTAGFQKRLFVLRDRIAAGSGLGAAMREQPDAFDELSIRMVEVGENSGTLDSVLAQLADFSERSQQLKDRVVNALFYPVVVFALSGGVALFLMSVVVPMLLDNLLEAGKSIPWPTRILKTASDVVRSHAAWIGLGVLACAMSLAVLHRTPQGKYLWHRTLLRLPLFGALIRKQELARLALVTATLLKSGIVLVQALEIGGRAVKNVLLREAVASAREAIVTGREIGAALTTAGEFPPTVVQIFTVGQQSGKLEDMLLRLAEDYDRQAAAIAMRLAILLEPALIIGLAAFVGFILFATILPILEAGNVL